MKVLAIGDPHFRTDNLPDVTLYIVKIQELVEREQPDVVVVLGDLLHYHERLHTNVLNKAYSFIQMLSQDRNVYVVVGNHDYINNSQFLSRHHWMNAMKEWKNVYIIDEGLVVGNLLFCPYVPPGRFKEALNIIDSDWINSKIIFCHQEIRGCKMGAIVSTEGDEWNITDPFIISGHIHGRQMPQSNVFYTGSSMQHAFGESHDKTVTLCDVSDTIELKNVSLGLPCKKTLYMSIDQLETFIPDGKDHIRITVKGELSSFTVFRKSKKYKELIQSGVKIVYRPEYTEIKNDKPAETYDNFDTILRQLIQDDQEMLELLQLVDKL